MLGRACMPQQSDNTIPFRHETIGSKNKKQNRSRQLTASAQHRSQDQRAGFLQSILLFFSYASSAVNSVILVFMQVHHPPYLNLRGPAHHKQKEEPEKKNCADLPKKEIPVQSHSPTSFLTRRLARDTNIAAALHATFTVAVLVRPTCIFATVPSIHTYPDFHPVLSRLPRQEKPCRSDGLHLVQRTRSCTLAGPHVRKGSYENDAREAVHSAPATQSISHPCRDLRQLPHSISTTHLQPTQTPSSFRHPR